jgi:OsmC-like protein
LALAALYLRQPLCRASVAPAAVAGEFYFRELRLSEVVRLCASYVFEIERGTPLTARPTAGSRTAAQEGLHFDADHPELFASEDHGATPVEYVLVGLASCLTAGIAAVADHRNIQLRSVTATTPLFPTMW